jgi:hypothetical protein
MQKNPKYGSEGVYPAYWQDEPLSFVLAKKQHELVKAGMSEDEAYVLAEKHAEKLEHDAYDSMVVVNKTLEAKGAKLPISANKEVGAEVAKWKRVLSTVPYDKLSDADQGEIDHLVQTKILKWNEVERDRRMRDPVFATQFDKLRDAVFPEMAGPRRQEFLDGREDFKVQQLNMFGIASTSQLQTAAPFYYEDYVHFFNRLKDQPYLGKWTERNREKLSRWIIDTLAMKAKLEGKSRIEMQVYLDAIRSQFFPMVKQPHRVKDFSLPSVDEIRSMLYSNDIGYRTEDSKLFVFRSYRLPMLLFPKETLTAIFTADHVRLQ